MRTFFRGAATLVGAVCLAATSAFAQTTDGVVPYRPIFGGAGGTAVDPNRRQDLAISVDFGESYDDNLLADFGGLNPSLVQKGGYYSAMTPRVDFESRGERLQVAVNAGSYVRAYQDVGKVILTNSYAGAGLIGRVTPRTSVYINSGVTYAPAYIYELFPQAPPALGAAVTPPGDYYGASVQRSFTYDSSARISHQFSPRAVFSVISGYRYTQYVERLPNYPDRRSYDIGGEYSYSLDRNVKLRFGYTYRDLYYSSFQQPTEHNVVAGIEYNRPLSKTRRTLVGFNVGPTMVTGPLAAREAASNQYRLVGDAFLDHQIGRTWHTRTAYHRGLGYIETVSEPVYLDSASIQASGFVSRRIDLLFYAGYATGDVASRGQPSQLRSYNGDTRLRFGLTREVAAYVEALYYQYRFAPDLVLAPGVPHELKRSGFRAGLTLWLPMRSNESAAR